MRAKHPQTLTHRRVHISHTLALILLRISVLYTGISYIHMVSFFSNFVCLTTHHLVQIIVPVEDGGVVVPCRVQGVFAVSFI